MAAVSSSDTQADSRSARNGRPRDVGREQAILDSAIELLATVGYEAMTIEAVAGRAGVGKATIYRRWEDKAQLVAEAIRRMANTDEPELKDTGSLRGDLFALTQMMFEKMGGEDGGLLCGLAVALRSDARLGQLLDSHKRLHNQQMLQLIVTRAKSRGEIADSAEPPEFIDVAIGLSFFQVMSGKELDDTFATYLVDKILIPLTR